MGLLGCGKWSAFLDCRGGGEALPLPFSSLSMSRRLDSMSDGNITLTGPRFRTLDPVTQAQCCGLLADLEPWENELGLWREGDEEMSWCGPIVVPAWRRDSVSIPARDLFQWFERRILEHNRTYVATDLGTIFHDYAVMALTRDVVPNIDLQIALTTILGDRSIDRNAGTRAADAMRELARSGLDFTMLGRTLLAGGAEVPTADLGLLITEHFDNHELIADGLATETESLVIGSRPNDTGPPVRATAGGIDAERGLVQGVVTESSIEDEASAQAAVDSRNDLLGESPTFFKARLLPSAPVNFASLIPGAVAELRVGLFCKEITGDHRLMDVDVDVDEEGVESVAVTFSSLGTTEEII